MYYLSFDVATKSLATSLLKINDYKNNIRNIKIESINDLKMFETKLDNTIEYVYYNVEDLIPGKKLKDTEIIERTNNLKKYLKKVNNVINILRERDTIEKIYLLIEYQLSSNYNANAIYNQIIYEFCDNIFEIHIINPAYKNRIYFSKELQHSRFIQKYSNNYIANKNHTKENFLFFLRIFKLEYVIDNIKKKNIDDLADSFLQIFGFIKFIKN